jgi:hypothetical protein
MATKKKTKKKQAKSKRTAGKKVTPVRKAVQKELAKKRVTPKKKLAKKAAPRRAAVKTGGALQRQVREISRWPKRNIRRLKRKFYHFEQHFEYLTV